MEVKLLGGLNTFPQFFVMVVQIVVHQHAAMRFLKHIHTPHTTFIYIHTYIYTHIHSTHFPNS